MLILWIVLAVVVFLVIDLVLVLWLVRVVRRRSAARPFRVPATLRAHRLDEAADDGDGRLHLDVLVRWPGQDPVDESFDEPTRARAPLPAFTDGMELAVFIPADRSTIALDWSRLTTAPTERAGAARAVMAAVPAASEPKAEAESRDWQVTCKTCGFTRSVWETGGVRYKAAGEATVAMACPSCGQARSHRVWRPHVPTAHGPAVA